MGALQVSSQISFSMSPEYLASCVAFNKVAVNEAAIADTLV